MNPVGNNGGSPPLEFLLKYVVLPALPILGGICGWTFSQVTDQGKQIVAIAKDVETKVGYHDVIKLFEAHENKGPHRQAVSRNEIVDMLEKLENRLVARIEAALRKR